MVIPDTRFKNEIKMIKKIGGEVWGVKRGDDPEWMVNYIKYGTEPTEIHPSEWEWVKSDMSRIIKNDGTLADLESTVKRIINSK